MSWVLNILKKLQMQRWCMEKNEQEGGGWRHSKQKNPQHFGHAEAGPRALVLEMPVPTTVQCFWDVTLYWTWSLPLNSALLSSPFSLAGGSNSQIAKTLTTMYGNEIIVNVLESLQQIWKPSSRMRPSMTYKSGMDSTFSCWSLPSPRAPWISPGSSNVSSPSSLGPKDSNKVLKSRSPPHVCAVSPHRSLPPSAYPRTGVSASALGSSPGLENARSGHRLQVSLLCYSVKSPLEPRNHSTAMEMPPSPGCILNRPQD